MIVLIIGCAILLIGIFLHEKDAITAGIIIALAGIPLAIEPSPA